MNLGESFTQEWDASEHRNVLVYCVAGELCVNVYQEDGTGHSLTCEPGQSLGIHECLKVEICGASRPSVDAVAYLVAARPRNEPQVWEGKTFCMSTAEQLRSALQKCRTLPPLEPSRVAWSDIIDTYG